MVVGHLVMVGFATVCDWIDSFFERRRQRKEKLKKKKAGK
jgi:hypothetical protein